MLYPTRRRALQSLTLSVAPRLLLARAPEFYTFNVLSLLKPYQMQVASCGPARLHCQWRDDLVVLEPGSVLPVNAARTPLTVTGPNNTPVSFVLTIAGVIRRRYSGRLTISQSDGLLSPVVAMDRETAVRSIIGAELPIVNTSPEALAAQAVTARSYLTAAFRPRHPHADFCDTTHCQFLRSPAFPGSPEDRAANATAPLVLACAAAGFPALYSAACGGETSELRTDRYHYTPVACEICRRAKFSRRGTGFGMCQEGALGLARLGWPWRAILAKYYPDSSLIEC